MIMRPEMVLPKNMVENGNPDSLTIGQLKKIVTQQRSKPKEAKLAFEYADRDSLAEELSEWFDFSQKDVLKRCLESFEADYNGSQPWSKMMSEDRKICVEIFASKSMHEDVDIRRRSCDCLAYISQGCYGEAKSKDHQIHNILKSGKVLRACNVYSTLFASLRKSVDQLSEQHGSHDQESEGLSQCVQSLMTALYFMLESSRDDDGLRQCIRGNETSLVAFLIELASKVGDDSEERLTRICYRQVSLLLWKSILVTLGGASEVRACKALVRERAGLSAEQDKLAIISSPLDYAVFRAELISKYPAYDPPPLTKEAVTEDQEAPTLKEQTVVELPVFSQGQWSSTPAPSPPPSPKGKKSLYTTDQNMPFMLPPGHSLSDSVPVSIEEAASLFQSRQRTTTAMLQLWQEQELFVKNERGWCEDRPTLPVADKASDTSTVLSQIELIYAKSLPNIQSCVSGLVSYVWNVTGHNLPTSTSAIDKEVESKIEESVANTRGWLFNEKPSSNNSNSAGKTPTEIEDFREMEIVLKAVSSILLLLLKWFRISHILKFEYLSQLILDADWIHTFHQTIMTLNPTDNAVEIHEHPHRSYFRICGTLSSVSQHENENPFKVVERIQPRGARPRASSSTDTLPPITKFSWRVLYTTVNILAITQKLVKKKVHRNSLLVQAKTWLHLRRPLRIPHDQIQLYVLKLYKGQVPLCSRKWRTGNMKVITQIYMSCRPELREDWIAGTDMDNDLDEARSQEAAIRALTLFYNTRRYPDSLISLGFSNADESDEDDDFFSMELSKLKAS